jgi:riboflavin kinase/FMN adenylyltransferase
MQVHFGFDSLPSFKNSIITIGTFDGVHLGHKKVIQTIIDEAVKCNGESVLITFDPHPRKVIKPEENLQLINTLDEKIALLQATHLDHLVVVPFTKAFSEQTAEAYIKDFLVSNFHPHTIIIGYDHHFGKGRQGNFNMLEEKSKGFGYRLLEIPEHALNEMAVSSTKIRNAILQPDIQTANALLGYPFFFEGKVVTGDKLGRTLGYPTANLEYINPDKIHLGHGVFAVTVSVSGNIKQGMLSIGNRPTLEHSDEKIEVNIFDFEEDIYGEVITVTVIRFLRQQEKYNSLDDLIIQLRKDKEASLAVLSSGGDHL